MSGLLTETSFPGISPIYMGQNIYHWTSSDGRCLALPGAQARLFNVTVNTASASLVIYVYDGYSVNGTLVAKIDGSTKGTYNFGGVRMPAGVFIDVVGGGSFDVTATMESAEPRGGALTLSGNEITDGVRTTATQGDGRTPPDSSIGIWDSTTNLVKQGGFESGLNASYWVENRPGESPVTSDSTTFLFGTKSIKLTVATTEGVGTGGNGIYGGGDSSGVSGAAGSDRVMPVTAGQLYTASCWIKAAVGVTLGLAVLYQDNLRAGTGSFSTTAASTGNWQRLTLTSTAPANSVGVNMYINSNGGIATFYNVDGVQFEQKPVATPYVETTTGTASRTASRVRAPSSLVSATQGWVAFRTRYGFPSTSTRTQVGTAFRYADDVNNGVRVYLNTDNTWRIMRNAAGSGSADWGAAETFATGDPVTVIGSWTATADALSVNGAATASGANTTIPTLTATTFDIGSNVGSSEFLNSDILWFACGTGTLTTADKTTINGWGSSDPAISWFPTAAGCTMVWHGNGSQYITP